MTANVARLALPFTDVDINAATADVRIVDSSGPTTFTCTVALPSVGGVNGRYYNGGSLGTGDTTTFLQPDESLVMAFALAVKAGAGFDLTVSETVGRPATYELVRQGGAQWEILFTDPLTTFDPEWLGFKPIDRISFLSRIPCDFQADRLWRAARPVFNRRREFAKRVLKKTWSGRISKRQLSALRIEWELLFSAQVGARIYLFDGTFQAMVDQVPGMVKDDPNLALESLWEWIASRGPIQYWADEDDLATSEFAEPLTQEMLDGVVRTINAERSNAPPVYDIRLPLISEV